MDKGPFRVQRPETKKTTVQQAPPQRSEAPVAPDASRVGYSRSPQPQPEKKSSKKLAVMGSILLVVALAAAGCLTWSTLRGSATGIDSSKYQVVSLGDGQVYFGTLTSADKDYMKLTNVYYLQPIAAASDSEAASDSDDLKDTSSDKNNFKLVKFTDIVYGPDNEMIISRSQIVHYDNLNPEGKVAKAIEQYKDAS